MRNGLPVRQSDNGPDSTPGRRPKLCPCCDESPCLFEDIGVRPQPVVPCLGDFCNRPCCQPAQSEADAIREHDEKQRSLPPSQRMRPFKAAKPRGIRR